MRADARRAARLLGDKRPRSSGSIRVGTQLDRIGLHEHLGVNDTNSEPFPAVDV